MTSVRMKPYLDLLHTEYCLVLGVGVKPWNYNKKGYQCNCPCHVTVGDNG